MRIAWYSNAPFAPTGYGVQTKLFTGALHKRGHAVAVMCNYGLQGGQLNHHGIELFPQGVDPLSMDVAPMHAKAWGADLLVSLFDAWVLKPDLLQQFGQRWCPWFPVDSHPIPHAVAATVRESWQPIAMSRHGQRMAEEAGIRAAYLPHAFDPADYHYSGTRTEARERHGIPTDRFVLGMVAANKGVPSRKAFPEVLEAFTRLHKRHPESLLYLHTDITQSSQGYNLLALANQLGVPEGSLIVCDQYRYRLGMPTAYMRNVYNAMDVLVSPSYGEGFGIPIMEAQACGTPVIVGGWTAMDELVRWGYTLDRDTESSRWWTPQGAYMHQPSVDAILDRMELAWQDWSAGKLGDDEHRRAVADQVAAEYGIDAVCDYALEPLLASLAERIAAEAEGSAEDVEVLA